MSGVVIVGAGLSGLASALRLLDAGTIPSCITVLEGRSRVGGRLKAHQGVDVGGAWCWNGAHEEFPALAERLSVSSFPQYDTGLNAVDYGESVARTKQPLDSAKVRFEGGAAAVTDRLASELRGKGVTVHLDCTVHHVSTAHGDAVRVEAKQAGEDVVFPAQVVVMAIPPRLALPPLMTWEPSLPAELAEAAKATPTWMGHTTKVLVTYPRPFWRELGMSGSAMSYGGAPIDQLYDSCGPNGGEPPHALCGFVFGNGAREPPADDVLRPQVLKQLERMFGAEATAPLSFSTHRWGEEPLTSGNGGAAGGGHSSMGNPALRKPFGSVRSGGPPRVWLAAAETDGEHGGLMEGAVLAGRRVADQAIGTGALSMQGQEATEGTCVSRGNAP